MNKDMLILSGIILIPFFSFLLWIAFENLKLGQELMIHGQKIRKRVMRAKREDIILNSPTLFARLK